MSESRKYRKFSAQQKLEIVLAGPRGDRTVREVWREHHVSETQYYGWRDQLLAAGRSARGHARPQALTSLRLTHLLAQRLRVHAEIGSNLSDRTPALKRKTNAALNELVGILLRSGHGLEGSSPPGHDPGLKDSVKPGTAHDAGRRPAPLAQVGHPGGR